jgi:hypothetical protein
LYFVHRAEILSSYGTTATKTPWWCFRTSWARSLAATEVYEAFGYRKSAYYKAVREGRLITAENLIRAARYLGLNPIDLQVRFGLIEPEAVTEYVESTRDRPRLRDLHPDPSKPPV